MSSPRCAETRDPEKTWRAPRSSQVFVPSLKHARASRGRRFRDLSCGGLRVYPELEVRRVGRRRCGKVKRERLEFLGDSPRYTKRFAFDVGRRCRSATVKDVTKELKLDWYTVKELDKQYMRAQLAKAGTPGPTVIGMRSRSARAVIIGSWSVTSFGNGRSGSVVRTAPRPVWASFNNGLARRRVGASGLP
jgi:transposase